MPSGRLRVRPRKAEWARFVDACDVLRTVHAAQPERVHRELATLDSGPAHLQGASRSSFLRQPDVQRPGGSASSAPGFPRRVIQLLAGLSAEVLDTAR